jgi:hypothetical protein
MTAPASGVVAARDRWRRITAWFLAVSYGAGAPAMAMLEFRRHLFSQRFDWPPALIYMTCVVQLACALGVLAPRLAVASAVGLTVTTLGAVASHFRIGSPLAAAPALLYTAVQVWFGIESRRRTAS